MGSNTARQYSLGKKQPGNSSVPQRYAIEKIMAGNSCGLAEDGMESVMLGVFYGASTAQKDYTSLFQIDI